MYISLWKEVADAALNDATKKRMLKWFICNKSKKTLVSVATRYRSAFGVGPHPSILMREAGWIDGAPPPPTWTYRRIGPKRKTLSDCL